MTTILRFLDFDHPIRLKKRRDPNKGLSAGGLRCGPAQKNDSGASQRTNPDIVHFAFTGPVDRMKVDIFGIDRSRNEMILTRSISTHW